MTRNTLVFFLLFFQVGSFAQQNILINPSFDYGLGNWYTILSVDHCSYPGSMQEGTVYTASGPGCAGVRFYHETSWADEKNWQEYLYQYIGSAEMHADTTYQVSVKFRLAGRCTYFMQSGNDSPGCNGELRIVQLVNRRHNCNR